MKKITLVALNAKYPHTNLAVRCLKNYAQSDYDIKIVESTINDDMDMVLEKIISTMPDAVGFSCYIWNIDNMLILASNLKKVLPSCFVFMGGPEVSYECEDIMQRNPFIDMIIKGEGENTFIKWLEAFENDDLRTDIKGTVVRNKQGVINNPIDGQELDLDKLTLIYKELTLLKNKIIYYESSRGCPMRCAYCISGIGTKLSYKSTPKVYDDFERYIKNNVTQVKLVDRTFNHPLDRAKEILTNIIKIKSRYPDSVTNFHFEITASLIDEEFIGIVSTAPEGLFQFEAGVQSTNRQTIQAISRNADISKTLSNIKKLSEATKGDIYSDLIAGLPYEDYDSFKKSFNDVYSLGTSKIHLGFLKLLKGSAIRADADLHDIEFSDNAPYKVLKTKYISFNELRTLEKIEKLLDLYKNSGNFEKSIKYVVENFESPFDFYEMLCEFAIKNSFFDTKQGILKQFDFLYDFVCSTSSDNLKKLKYNLSYDWAAMERPKRYPKCIEPKDYGHLRSVTRKFFNNPNNIEKYLHEYSDKTAAEISRMCYLLPVDTGNNAVLFDYRKPKARRGITVKLK